MLKTRKDFSTEQDYSHYTKTSDFLLEYSWEGKVRDQIIHEMALPEFEQDYLDAAMKELSAKKDFNGMSLDRLILDKLDEDDDTEMDLEGVEFLERNE